MASPNRDPDEKSFLHELRKHPALNVLWRRRLEWIAALFLLIGLLISFFHLSLGGLFVGVAAGLTFYGRLEHFCLHFRAHYLAYGLFKTVVFFGLILYFLITIPLFVIGMALSFGILALVRMAYKK